MQVTRDQIDEWAANNFEGLGKHHLRAACRFLELEAPPATGIEGLKLRLRRHYGIETDSPSADVLPSGLRHPPNLRYLKNWAGRRYRIKAQPLDQQMGNKRYPIIWEGQAFWMDPRKPHQDVPAPVFNIIKDAIGTNLQTKWNQAKQAVDKEWIESNRIPYVFLGVTPGTEALPESLIDWYKQDCRDNGFYAGLTRQELGQVWGILTDQAHPNKEEKELATDEWRRQVLWLLELTPEQIFQKENPPEEIAEDEEEYA